MRDIKEVLHLYLGCELIHEFDGESVNIGKMIGITESEINPGETIVITSDSFSEWFVDQVKPILRPLSSLTEVEDQVESPANNRGNYIDEHWYPEGYLWLLSKSFDLFGLIESNLAINKTTL